MDWNTARWNLTNMEEYDVELESMCQTKSNGELLVIPGAWSTESTEEICQQLGGEMNIVKDDEESVQVSAMMNVTDSCSRYGGNFAKLNGVHRLLDTFCL